MSWRIYLTIPSIQSGSDIAYCYVLPPTFPKTRKEIEKLLKQSGSPEYRRGIHNWIQYLKNVIQKPTVSPPTALEARINWRSDSGLYDEDTRAGIRWHSHLGYGYATAPIPQSFDRLAIVTCRVYAGLLILAETTTKFGCDKCRVLHPNSPNYWVPHLESGRKTARGYSLQKIFASYAREDLHVVEAVASVCDAIGSSDLRWDLKVLKSGDNWEKRVQDEISIADSFQLFWSENASASLQVEQEWRYALKLNRENFIRPVYWNIPMPPPPEGLKQIHFAKVELLSECRN
jgi:hypothetical protein